MRPACSIWSFSVSFIRRVPFNPLKYQTKYVDVTTDSGEVVE